MKVNFTTRLTTHAEKENGMTDNALTFEGMANEVYAALKSPRSFDLQSYRGAFANVAHQHDIWHHKDCAKYNNYFRKVMTELKKLISKPRGLQPVERSTTPTPPPTHVNRPYIDRMKLAAGDYDD